MNKIDRIKYNDTYYDIGGTSGSSEGDSLPIGTIVEYDGIEIPDGFVEVQGGDGGDNYSYDEIKIGTWVDGKPLYRKVIKLNGAERGRTLSYNISSLNIDRCTLIRGFEYSSSLVHVGLDFYNAGQNNFAHLSNSSTIMYKVDWDCNELYFILEYTKTTD